MRSLTTKRTVVFALILGAVVTFAGWSQTWVTLEIVATDVKVKELVASGQSSTVLPAGLALVTLATALLLLTAKRTLSYVIGAINIAVGFGRVVLTTLFAIDPINFQYAQLTKISGISDHDALHEIVGAQVFGGGLYTSALGGIVIFLASVALLAGAHRWKATRSRFETAVRDAAKSSGGDVTTLDAWDDLTRGTDPTT